jgi:hypothetical protein
MEFRNLFLGRSKNAALLRAIENVASSDNPQNRTNLYRALLDSVLLVPVPEIPGGLAEGTHTLPHPVQIALLQLTDSQQRQVTPAFTDEEALRNWDPNTPFVGLKADLYFRLVKGMEISAILINPFDPVRKMLRPGGRIMRFEFEALADGILPGRPDASGATFMTFVKGQSVLIGEPATPPSPQILEALSAAGRSAPEIRQLYLFQMSTEEGDSRAVIGIDWRREPEDSRARTILDALAQAVHPFLAGRNFLDFMVVKDSLGEAIRQRGKKLMDPES